MLIMTSKRSGLHAVRSADEIGSLVRSDHGNSLGEIFKFLFALMALFLGVINHDFCTAVKYKL